MTFEKQANGELQNQKQIGNAKTVSIWILDYYFLTEKMSFENLIKACQSGIIFGHALWKE